MNVGYILKSLAFSDFLPTEKMNIRVFMLIIVFILESGNLVGQSVSINSFSISAVCQGKILEINFTSEGTFNADNVFYAQLSDETGSFTTPARIGYLNHFEAGSAKISAQIPVTLNPGKGYRVRIVSGNPEIESMGMPITIKALPQRPTVSNSGNTTFCQGGSVILTSSKETSYVWNNKEITSSITVTESGNYFVTVENNEGCTATSEITTVIVNPLPEATINATEPTTFCEGESIVLTASTGVRYLWNNEETTREIEVDTSGSYFVTITDGNGCSAKSISTEVIVNPLPPQPTVTSEGTTSLCRGSLVKLISSAGETYLWSNGVTLQENIVNTAGHYSVTISDCNGCKSTSLPTLVTVNKAPDQPTIKHDGELTFCQGGSVKLTSSEGERYLWSNGATSREIEVFSSDSYYVMIFDENGCSAISEVIAVTVNPTSKPVVTPGGKIIFCHEGFLKLTSSEGQSYYWNNGATTRDITVTASGSYAVEVTDENGCSATSEASEVTLNPLPSKPTIIPDGKLTFCQGDSVKLIASEGVSYFWNNGATSQKINVTSSGSYEVIVTDENGCSGNAEAIIVTVNPQPDQPIIIPEGDLTFCQGGSLKLTSNTTMNCLWSNGATTPSITVDTTGLFFLKITNDFGCSATSANTKVTVNSLPVATILADGPTAFCEGSFVNLTANAGSSFMWNNGSTSKTINIKNSGSFSVTVTDVNGCVADSDPVTVTVTVNPISPPGSIEFVRDL